MVDISLWEILFDDSSCSYWALHYCLFLKDDDKVKVYITNKGYRKYFNEMGYNIPQNNKSNRRLSCYLQHYGIFGLRIYH